MTSDERYAYQAEQPRRRVGMSRRFTAIWLFLVAFYVLLGYWVAGTTVAVGCLIAGAVGGPVFHLIRRLSDD